MRCLLFLAFAVGCGGYTAPGDGVPKGCRDRVELQGMLDRALGISSHVESGEDPASAAARAFEVGAWGELGVGHIRRDLTWSALEPERGVWDFARPDRVLEATEAADVELLGILDYGNPWASASGIETRPPDDLADFTTYAQTTAERYAGRVWAYEVWNEENAGAVFWEPQEDPVAYGELLVATSEVVRAADPGALVSFGGVFSPELLNMPGAEFVRQVLASVPDLGAHIDAMAFHPYRYPFTAPEVRSEHQESLLDTTCEMLGLADEIGVEELWVTELGWHTAPLALATGVSDEEQAHYLVRSAVLSLAQGVQRFAWYTFTDSGTDPIDQEQMFGLYAFDPDPTVAPDAEPKPAVGAYTLLAEMLRGRTALEDRSELLGLGEDSYAYALVGASDEVLVLWAVEDDEVLVPGRGAAQLRDLYGRTQEVDSEGGAFEVALGPAPVFLIPPAE